MFGGRGGSARRAVLVANSLDPDTAATLEALAAVRPTASRSAMLKLPYCDVNRKTRAVLGATEVHDPNEVRLFHHQIPMGLACQAEARSA
jgi:hypothetical protein